MTSLPKRRILCIDRDRISLSLRSAIVETCGFVSVSRRSIESGQQVLREQQIDAVVIDENALEGRDGTSRLAELFPALPVLLLSSRAPYSHSNGSHYHLHRFNKQDGPVAFVAALRDCMANGGGLARNNSEAPRPFETP